MLRQVVLQPGQAFAWIVAQEKQATWFTPLLVIAILVAVNTILPILMAPPSAMFNSPGAAGVIISDQATLTEEMAVGVEGEPLSGPINNGPVTPNVWLPAIAALIGMVITWLLLGVLTNLMSLAFGGRSSALMALNLAAWASLPVGARNLVQILYTLATNQAVVQPGLSGFIPMPENGFSIWLQQVLVQVDLYLFWQIALLGIAVGVWGRLSGKKSLLVAILAVGIVILLQSLLGLGLGLLGMLNFGGAASVAEVAMLIQPGMGLFLL
jgi:hypothetical protein